MHDLLDNPAFRADYEQLRNVKLNPARHAAPTAFVHCEMVAARAAHLAGLNGCTPDEMSLPKDRASELFPEAMALLLDRHEAKKFHDPVAAVCHLHPEVGAWVQGRMQKIEAGLGTVLNDSGDYILADLDYDAFWRHVQTWT